MSLIYTFYLERKIGISPVSTLPWVRKEIFECLKAYNKSDEIRLAELGSGWGGLAIAISKKFPNMKIIAYEVSPYPFLISQIKSFFAPKNIRFQKRDFFAEDLSSQDILIAYLTPQLMEELYQKLQEDNVENVILISIGFEIKGLKPKRVIKKKGL